MMAGFPIGPECVCGRVFLDGAELRDHLREAHPDLL